MNYAVKKTVKNMIGGVSQQPPLQRLESQCEAMVNCIPSITDFLRRRTGVNFIAELNGINADNSFIEFIERGDNDAGLVIHYGDTRVYKLDGKEISKITSSESSVPSKYLGLGSDKRQDKIKLCTVRDYNFLLNNNAEVSEFKGSLVPVIKRNLIFIKQANYDQKYEISVDGRMVSYTTPRTDEGGYVLSAETIAMELAKQISNSVTVTPPPTETELGQVMWVYGEGNSGTSGFIPVSLCGYWTGSEWHIEARSDTPAGWSHFAYSGTIATLNNEQQQTYSITKTIPEYDDNGGVKYNTSIQFTTVNKVGGYFTNKQINTTPRGVYFKDGKYIPYWGTSVIEQYINEVKSVAAAGGVSANTSVIQYGNVIYVTGANSVKVTNSAYDPYISVIADTVRAISELPVIAPNKYPIKVLGDVSNNSDDYYVEFVCEDENVTMGRGGWKESVKRGHDFAPYQSCMPVVLKINADKITLETIDWGNRQAGDKETNPSPSFMGKTIKDVFFYNNRLGFITDDTVVLSEAGEYFNFYQTTALALLDSDPIDIAVSGTKVSPLKYVLPYTEGLFIYSDRSLYVLEYGDVLSTANVELKPVLQFDTDLTAEPVVCDTSIYYAGRKGNYNQIREYKPNTQTDSYGYSNNITSHIPEYIQGTISKMLVSLEDGVMFLLNNTSTIYCYSFIKDNNELLLSSWHKWEFKYPVVNGFLFQGWLYLVFKKSNNIVVLGKVMVSGKDDQYYDQYGGTDIVDYTSSYTYSPYFIRDNQGSVKDIPTMIRTMDIKHIAGSEAELVIKRKNRKEEVRKLDSKRDHTRFLAASENKDLSVTIRSIEKKPFNIIETDYEVLYASRS